METPSLTFGHRLDLCERQTPLSRLSSLSDFHKSAPYVATGSVDQTVKVWQCR